MLNSSKEKGLLYGRTFWGEAMEKPVDSPPAGQSIMDADEADLIRAAQAHSSAFALLYQRYLSRVYYYVRARMASDEDAADLTQQIFLQVLDALPDYQPRGAPFAAWLFQIARNAVTDFYRRRKTVVSWDSLPGVLQTTGQDMDATLVHQERLAHLKTLLAQLDPTQRELLALRFAAGLSAPQIAQVVGKSHAAVKKQLTRLLHTLKEQYREQ
jgi:RNA polymerase sigma-70 factor, ECF subfamily